MIGFSATWTAPPASIAPPAAVAESFAKAVFTDMSCTFHFTSGRLPAGASGKKAFPFTSETTSGLFEQSY
ncbi:hypothetical protein G7A66_08670 [Altererythrobacter sp. SALINAS58]|nr:hypothetical protein [Alteripontixanthobacter muriae]